MELALLSCGILLAFFVVIVIWAAVRASTRTKQYYEDLSAECDE